MREKFLLASVMHFAAVKSRAEANLEAYLSSSVGVGEHPDLVQEIIELTKIIVEADEALKYLERK